MAGRSEDIVEGLMVAAGRGRSYFRQVLDILGLVLARRAMFPADYYWYALYDPSWTDEERSRMIGDRWHTAVVRSTCQRDWWSVARDKVLNYLLLSAHGFEVPVVTAIYHPHRPYPNATQLKTREAVLKWLREDCPYPQFTKPASGVRSQGQALLTGYDAEKDVILRQGEEPIAAEAFADLVCRMEGQLLDDGFLFQDLLPPDSRLDPVVGSRLTGVRLVVILEEAGPRIIHALWKIPAGSNIADNYWRSGNLLADLDLETGEVKRVVTGTGTRLKDVKKHPDTKHPLLGFTIPDWDRVLDIGLRGSVVFPKLRYQGWDIGLCEGGPRVIEANLGSAFSLPQIVQRKGFMTPEFERFLAWSEARVDEVGPLHKTY